MDAIPTFHPKAFACALATATALALSVAPIAAAQPSQANSPAPRDLQTALREDLNLSIDQFNAEAELSAKLSARAESWERQFPGAFSGVWLNKGVAVVGVNSSSPEATELAREVAATGFTTSATNSSLQQLESAAAELEDAAAFLQEDATVRVDVTNSTVDIQASGEVARKIQQQSRPTVDTRVTPAARHMRHIQSSGSLASLADPVTPSIQPSSPQNPATSSGAIVNVGPSDGIAGTHFYSKVTSTTAASCSLGFNGTLTQNNETIPVNITAGHCNESIVGNKTFLASNEAEFGTFQLTFNPAFDVNIIRIHQWYEEQFSNNLVRIDDSKAIAIKGVLKPVPGKSACKYGYRTGYTCGELQNPSSSNAPAGTMDLGTCGLQGDSGGVVFAGQYALGITSRSNANDINTGYGLNDCETAWKQHGQYLAIEFVRMDHILSRIPGLKVRTS